ncbi:hypothetical protein GCM10010492_13260 [Saccharothrix mutabilis subsp. mutabilis]|uniref:Uncharacterized protein n=1 Tax=Saccharothrix mutabilis subsp. mutabilis TaxID=66855 RepID=A0ABP3CVW9_9PSEU
MVGNVLWALAGALAVALAVTAWTWPVAVRRRRAHAALVRDAVARMCAQGDRPTRLGRLARDVVDVLLRQDEGAAVLGRTPGADVDRLADRPEDAALLVSAEAVTAPHPLGRRDEPVDDSAWRVPGRAPRVADHPEPADLCARARRTAQRRIARARLVLAQADRLGDDAERECRERLRAAFDRAEDQVRAAGAQADALAALRALTRVELPVPEDGVPGQADAPDLRAQVNALARLALRHRAAVAAHRGTPQVITGHATPAGGTDRATPAGGEEGA